VLKRYPRYSETFVVNEILAHEEAGLDVHIFSLRPPGDTHYQSEISLVRAPVTYLSVDGLKTFEFWDLVRESSELLPGLWPALAEARHEDWRVVCQAVMLAREALGRSIGWLHAHFATSATSVARLAARFARVPFSFTAHAKDIFHESVRPDDLRRKLVDADAAVTVSDYNRGYLRETFGSAADRVFRVYNGLDLERFPFHEPAEREPKVVAVGRLVEKKGFGDLVTACAILAGRGREFRCEIVGSGPLEGELKSAIESAGISSVVELAGPRPQADVTRRLRDAAVLAAPCVVGSDGNRDGLPTVILEAMALGTPCVSTTVTGIPEAVRHEETGLLVAPGDPEALADSIDSLLQSRDRRCRLAAAARRMVESEFDVRKNSAGLRSLFGRPFESRRTAAVRGAAG
jgi:glycosyltransferase involved in cell wall biosynthesis